MKSITLIACTAVLAFTLTAFAYSSWNNTPTHIPGCQAATEIEPPTFFYNLSAPANNSITKERLHNARALSDLIPDYSNQKDLKNNVISVRDISIRIEEEDVTYTKLRTEKSDGNNLSKAQMNLLKSTDYSTNFFLQGFYTSNGLMKGLGNDRYFNYHMSVVPEAQATYKAGNTAFIDYLNYECQSTIAKVRRGNLKSGNISFTVTKAGTIADIKIKSSCGYPSVDEKMVELMNQLPDGWNVATNGQGEKVDQTLVFTYGQGGC